MSSRVNHWRGIQLVNNFRKIVVNIFAILIYILILPFVLVCWLVDKIRGIYDRPKQS